MRLSYFASNLCIYLRISRNKGELACSTNKFVLVFQSKPRNWPIYMIYYESDDEKSLM
jgi:hypothetical protein